MDMRGQAQRRFTVNLTHQKNYQFVSQASEDGRVHGERYVSDEPDPVGDNAGPSTPALLATALGHCLSAALIEALRRSDLNVLGCETEVTAVVQPNSDGNPRIDHVDVTVRPRLDERQSRMNRCAEIFQNHCTVTSSVKRGIDVRVHVEWQIESEVGGLAAN
jgi:uncharacterized OsmC-like protein